MIGLLQRVTEARVVVAGETVGRIGRGLLVLIGVERGDGESQADRLLERLLGYRVFPDADGRMNLSVSDIGGGLLLVPHEPHQRRAGDLLAAGWRGAGSYIVGWDEHSESPPAPGRPTCCGWSFRRAAGSSRSARW